MADIFWKTWDADYLYEGSRSFFHSLNLQKNPYFPSLQTDTKKIRQVILLGYLPKDRAIFVDWLHHGGSIWLDFFCSLTPDTLLFAPQQCMEEFGNIPVVSRVALTEYVFHEVEKQAESLFSSNLPAPCPSIRNTYLPAVLLDADRIIPITCLQHSYQFSQFCLLSSLYYLLPTITQVEIQLLQKKEQQAEALVMAIGPLLKKIPLSLAVQLYPTSFMVLSNDVVSADAYSAMLNGLRVSSLPFLKAASKHQYGVSDVLMIHNRSERFHQALNHPHEKWNRLSKLRIDHSKCNLCLQCSTACPFQAFVPSVENRLDWNANRCNRCGLCLDICPENAIYT